MSGVAWHNPLAYLLVVTRVSKILSKQTKCTFTSIRYTRLRVNQNDQKHSAMVTNYLLFLLAPRQLPNRADHQLAQIQRLHVTSHLLAQCEQASWRLCSIYPAFSLSIYIWRRLTNQHKVQVCAHYIFFFAFQKTTWPTIEPKRLICELDSFTALNISKSSSPWSWPTRQIFFSEFLMQHFICVHFVVFAEGTCSKQGRSKYIW